MSVAMIEIDKERAITLVTEVVTERGEDYCYTGKCRYVRFGEPSCLIGVALHKAGVPVETLAHFDTCIDSSITHLEREGELRLHNITLTPGAVTVFEKAQQLQDDGHPYGDVLNEALRPA